jgi:outer membrane protein assembly factor BamB
VYAIGATGILNCLDAADGHVVWSTNILEQESADNIAHGVCASPLVLDDRVFVCPTGSGGPSLAAYDRLTGNRIWVAGEYQASYSSPTVANLCGTLQILLYDSDGLSAYHSLTGKMLWHYRWTNNARTNVAQPIPLACIPDHVFISTGYDKGCTLVGIGQIETGNWSIQPRWQNNRMKTKFCTAVAYGEHVFGLDDGILACVDLETGERTWKAGRYGHGQILRAGGLLIVQAESGDIVLGKLDPKRWHELARIQALSGKTWNHPALAGPYLLVRNDRDAACFELPLVEQSDSEYEPVNQDRTTKHGTQ